MWSTTQIVISGPHLSSAFTMPSPQSPSPPPLWFVFWRGCQVGARNHFLSICNPERGNQEFKIINLENFKFGRNRGEIRSDDLPIKEPGFLPTCFSTSVRILNLELHWVNMRWIGNCYTKSLDFRSPFLQFSLVSISWNLTRNFKFKFILC